MKDDIAHMLPDGFSYNRRYTSAFIERYHYHTVNSTQTLLKQVVQSFHPGKVYLVTADSQSAGIGQRVNKWYSPTGNIYATFGFTYSSEQKDNFFCIPHTIALSILHTLDKFGIKGTFKWVNDVYVNRKKISGILVESIQSEKLPLYFILIGIGINVNVTLDVLDVVDQPVTSIAHEIGNVSLESVLQTLSVEVCNGMNILFQDGFSSIRNSLFPRLEKFNNQIIVFEECENRCVEGKIVGLDPKCGALILRLKDGSITKYISGRIIKTNV
ncbi:biotin--[acetyl-CoA-carboxylase] ligase [Candidatus Sneabacter namystus]|uniref:biotin--[biotin carboxyl-carrier protein] ligase n=1 Tax=Candidatus Sneabacter namystus TaxID=2601646 RepID=A0A5C0UHK8_9RICK|nr:biotin--[acetyl-CoA-carboxylase] ligase [Candidatus Sneabacter namystus]QEK39618.1 biotin--[acetyl-CoA-carboxylase] ligase [Candidatus Sneabacter namystus]